jgi:enoyl-CoA hydratase/carnithine racemase
MGMTETNFYGLRLEYQPPVCVITIDNPEEKNRLTEAALDALLRVAAECRTRNDVHVVVVQASGSEWFCTGLLNPVLRGQMTKEQVIELVRKATDAFEVIESLPQLVIAAINGNVFAGGVELALACDLRIVAQHAVLCMPEAKWGGFPGAGGPLRLARLVGRSHALDLICTGREIESSRMASIGFAQHVVPTQEFEASVQQYIREIAGNGPLAVRGAKQIMKVDELSGIAAARDTAWSLRRELEWSEDVDEGIRAHREGRPPRFGRR